MCGISGIYNVHKNIKNISSFYEEVLFSMVRSLEKRGPNGNGIYLSTHCGLAHTRLAIIDLLTGEQPIAYRQGERLFTIIYNGELYNTSELKCDLRNCGYSFQTSSDGEVVLIGIVEYGPDFVKRLNGVFAFAILEEPSNTLYLFRDRMGVKPLFYSNAFEDFVFSSELKGLFAHPMVKHEVDRKGLNEIFSLGPAKTPGCGVFKGIDEVLPAHYLKVDKNGIKNICYWHLESKEHVDSYEKTLEKTKFLVSDAIKRQMVSDVPICTFLSGGVDSSLVSAVCAEELKKSGEKLTTFSFDFVDNDKHFTSNVFQPTQDRPYADIMIDYIDSNHHYLECTKEMQADLLYKSVLAHDLPAMADIDSSMLFFCSVVKDYNKVVLTGECADEIFGGYPWFHKEELFSRDTFPWTTNLAPRKSMLKNEFCEALQMEDYVNNAYYNSLLEVPTLSSDNSLEKRRREIAYLNLKWFMQTLLDRTDRTSMYCGLEARVPFADYRIVEYLFNAPWEMKAKNGMVKNLLRTAFKGYLPDEILFRKKSPYPKTYDPNYESLLKKRFEDVLSDSSAPILNFLDAGKVERFLNNSFDYGKPWYGQLMAGPQMIAYMIQVNYWLTEYDVNVIV